MEYALMSPRCLLVVDPLYRYFMRVSSAVPDHQAVGFFQQAFADRVVSFFSWFPVTCILIP